MFTYRGRLIASVLHVALCLFVCLTGLRWRGRRRIIATSLITIAVGRVLWRSGVAIVGAARLLWRLSISVTVVILLLIIGVVVAGGIVRVEVRSVVTSPHAAFGIGWCDVER